MTSTQHSHRSPRHDGSGDTASDVTDAARNAGKSAPGAASAPTEITRASAEAARVTQILTHAAAIELALLELRGAVIEAGADAILLALSREIDRVRDAVKESATTAARTRADEAVLQAHLAAMEAEDRLRIVGPFIQRTVAAVKRKAASAVAAAASAASAPLVDVLDAAAEPVRLQLALARMDAVDIIDERHERARAELRSAEHATVEVLARLQSRIAKIAETIVARM